MGQDCMRPNLSSLDHFVLTVQDIDQTIRFYRDVLGMIPEKFQPADGSVRWALKFGDQKINLHQTGAEFEPKAAFPKPGSADLCFLSDVPFATWQDHFANMDVVVEEGPIRRTGAVGPIHSLYIRDPDMNLIEVSNPG